MSSITVRRDDLEQLSRRLLERMPSEVKLDTDYYLVIDTAEWDHIEEPPEPGIGSLHDDWQELQRALGDSGRHFSAVDIERFASVLRAISERLVS